MKPFECSEVAAVFETYPPETRAKLMFLRQLIFDTATESTGVGPLEETLKWGQSSYLTTVSRSGSTIRIDRVKSEDGRYAMYFHCQMTLIDTFRSIYGDRLRYEGSRSLLFHATDVVPVEELRHCIFLALTYHQKKKPAAA